MRPFYFLNKLCLAGIFVLVSPSFAFAQLLATDAKLGFYSRTYPVGAQIGGTGGLDVLLWGDPSSWKYGFARLGLNLNTSAVINRGGFEIQLNPISIVSLSAGYDWGVRNFTPKFVDCSVYECRGRLDRKFVKTTVVGAYQKFVFSFLARYEELRDPDTTKPFFDEVTLLSGDSSGQAVVTLNPALLYTVNEQLKVGGTSLLSKTVGTDRFTHLWGPVASYQSRPDLSFLGGIGLNRSPLVHSGWAAFLVLQYTLKPSLNIVDLPLRAGSTYSSLF
jgi:hypothetical protein